MRTTRFSEVETIYAPKHIKIGISVKEIARKYGVCDNTVYRRGESGLGKGEDLEYE